MAEIYYPTITSVNDSLMNTLAQAPATVKRTPIVKESVTEYLVIM